MTRIRSSKYLACGVGADLHDSQFSLGQIRDELDDILDASIGETDRAAGEVGVASAHRLRRLLECDDALAGFAGGERRAEGCVARADNDYVCCVVLVHGV